jgi:hypothetical protein
MDRKACTFLMALFILLCSFSTLSLAGEADLLPFEPDDTLEEIRAKIQHNGYQFTVDHNWVFDMPEAEKQRFFSRSAPLLPVEAGPNEAPGPLLRHLGERQLPSAFDWRNYNGHAYIGPIRDQGNCGSCYAFGACAAAEGTYNWATGKYDANCADFSESYIIWCLARLPEYSSHFYGCAGADYTFSELTALTEEGVTSEADFPYTPFDFGSCSHWGDPTTVFDSWHRIGCNDITAIKTAIMTYGVVDAAVYLGSAFQAYRSGIYQDTNTTCYSNPCYYTPTNHCIALVGWDDNGGNGYWILRNSWGADWGENGYMRIKYTSAHVACEAAYLVYGSVGSTLYVDNDGTCGGRTPCYSTIQSAVNNASPGSMIKIRAGSYAEDLYLNSAAPYTLTGGWNATFTSQTSTSSVYSMTFGKNSAAVTVEYMEIE